MKLIVGLGNPGEKYKNNRHNVGFQFVDYLIENLQISNNKSQITNKSQILNCNFKKDKYLDSEFLIINSKLILAKPTTFMNKSGGAVRKLIGNWKLEIGNLIIAHDDLDIPFGKFHIQVGVGPELHNGIESIENHLRNRDFLRIRVGVDNRIPERKIDGETYVLSNFTQEEFTKLNSEIFPKIIDQLKLSHQIS
ncbi:MAG: Peptidyl-tRNA hydrolase [Candidatus Roizmanbacteria bacterium GW2011_GWC2_35_12]|uniref:Peptidyl-tRNA hydrolase n=1 Tax=Candidatus Roizmanbacteria bacterium GW2011_GWC2_35_12 TaxID=1618485 RepID=A0A0G0BRD3_9BACT|nr:MAG: Peptidyl-tRNA hydrolase [Candidatus Roizmanbacteria bacterium GW2011_GWC2_35_12]